MAHRWQQKTKRPERRKRHQTTVAAACAVATVPKGCLWDVVSALFILPSTRLPYAPMLITYPQRSCPCPFCKSVFDVFDVFGKGIGGGSEEVDELLGVDER